MFQKASRAWRGLNGLGHYYVISSTGTLGFLVYRDRPGCGGVKTFPGKQLCYLGTSLVAPIIVYPWLIPTCLVYSGIFVFQTVFDAFD